MGKDSVSTPRMFIQPLNLCISPFHNNNGSIQQFNSMNNIKDIQYYEQKVRDLQLQNQVLRGQLLNSSRTHHPVQPQTIIELQSRNQRLERTAYKYERSIKSDLSYYLADSMVQGECFYRNRYNKLLNESRNHYKLHF